MVVVWHSVKVQAIRGLWLSNVFICCFGESVVRANSETASVLQSILRKCGRYWKSGESSGEEQNEERDFRCRSQAHFVAIALPKKFSLGVPASL